MSKFRAVRIGDPYVCSKHPLPELKVAPGPLNPKKNVWIEDMPAAKTLDLTTCPGPPQLDVLNHGCSTVHINGQLAVRTIQDLTLHQNTFQIGASRTFIGVVGDSAAVTVPASMREERGGSTGGAGQEQSLSSSSESEADSERNIPPKKCMLVSVRATCDHGRSVSTP